MMAKNGTKNPKRNDSNDIVREFYPNGFAGYPDMHEVTKQLERVGRNARRSKKAAEKLLTAIGFYDFLPESGKHQS